LAAYLLAESFEASGVLAVVVSGLWMSRTSPRLFPPNARRQVQTVMTFLTSLLNGALFVLVGIEVQSAVRGLDSVGLARGLAAVAVVSAAVIGVRFAWFFTTPYLIRLLDRRPRQQSLRLGARPRIVMAAAGFRGAVSLAAALAVPEMLTAGGRFPDRDLIVFVTAGVIAVTLLVQAPLLPRVIQWARIGRDETIDQERRQAEIAALEAALEAFTGLVDDLGTDREVAEHLRESYARRLRVLRGEENSGGGSASDWERQYADLHLALLACKHATVVRLRDQNDVDDTVLQQVQAMFDLEEAQVSLHRDVGH